MCAYNIYIYIMCVCLPIIMIISKFTTKTNND